MIIIGEEKEVSSELLLARKYVVSSVDFLWENEKKKRETMVKKYGSVTHSAFLFCYFWRIRPLFYFQEY